MEDVLTVDRRTALDNADLLRPGQQRNITTTMTTQSAYRRNLGREFLRSVQEVRVNCQCFATVSSPTIYNRNHNCATRSGFPGRYHSICDTGSKAGSAQKSDPKQTLSLLTFVQQSDTEPDSKIDLNVIHYLHNRFIMINTYYLFTFCYIK